MNIIDKNNIRISRDVHTQAQIISQWQQQYAQISRGAFEGVGINLSLDQADFYFEQMNRATYQKGCIPESSIGLVIALACDEEMATCGKSVNQGDVVLISGQSGYEFKSVENMKALMISIRKGSGLEKYLTEEVNLNLDGQPGVIATISSTDICKIEAAFHESSNVENKCTLSNVNLIDTLTDSLFNQHLSRQKSSTSNHSATTLPHYWDIIKKSYSIIINQPYEVRSVSQLVDELHISRGTLQTATQQTIGLKAAEFLRAIRLNQVLKSVSIGNSVTTSATYWGFLHLSHFAREYKKLFGELPSQTLRNKLDDINLKHSKGKPS